MSLKFEKGLKPAGEGLLWAYLKILDERASGILTLEWERFRKQFIFRRGEPILSKSNWPLETFTYYLVKRAVVSQSEIQEILKKKDQEASKDPLGEYLVKSGRLSLEAINELLQHHFEERMFNLLALSHGQLNFEEVQDSKLETVESMRLSKDFRHLLWGAVKVAFTESVCRGKIAGFITRKGKLKGACPLALAPQELRQWNELSANFQVVNSLSPLGLQLFALASEFGLIEWAESDEEKISKEMQDMLESFKTKRAHEILNVEISAESEEVRKVYMTLVKKFHPDRLPPTASTETKKTSEAVFAKINESYAIMTDPDKRKEFLAQMELDASGGAEKIQAHLQAEMSIPQAKAALRRRHFKQAYEMYSEIAKALDKDAEVIADTAFSEMMMAAEAKVDLKPRMNAFRESFKKALELRKDYADAYYYRGVSWRIEGLDDRALADFDRAIQLNPRLAEAVSEARLLRLRKDKKSQGMFGKKK